MSEANPEEKRQEIFRRLVEVQDEGKGVEESRRLVADEHRLGMDEVVQIEREGLAAKWPPL